MDNQELNSENGDTPTSPSSISSSKTVVYESGVEAYSSQEKSQRGSISCLNNNKQRPNSAPERRSSGTVRPNSPPPLPPQPPGKVLILIVLYNSVVCLNLLKFMFVL